MHKTYTHCIDIYLSEHELKNCTAGAGKSSLVKKLFDEFGQYFGFSVSHTTRSARIGEEHGKHYYFVTLDEMQKAIDNKEFIEHANYSGKWKLGSRYMVCFQFSW